jgi:hypothetical protein
MFFIYLLFNYLSIQDLLTYWMCIYKLKVFWYMKKSILWLEFEYLLKSTFFIYEILIEGSLSKSNTYAILGLFITRYEVLNQIVYDRPGNIFCVSRSLRNENVLIIYLYWLFHVHHCLIPLLIFSFSDLIILHGTVK